MGNCTGWILQSNVFFDAQWIGGGIDQTESLVLRLLMDSNLTLQWRMMETIASRSDIPVPPLSWADWEGRLLGAPCFTMANVPGTVPQSEMDDWVLAMSPNHRGQLMTNALTVMSTIHRLDWRDGFAFLDHPKRGETGLDQYLSWVEQWCAWVSAGRSFPLFEQAARDLRRRQPVNQSVSLIWGDSRIGNMIFADDHSVAAILDWEMAALGPAEVDLGWWFMMERFMTVEAGAKLPEGMPTRAETVKKYQQLLGRPMKHMPYYETLAAFRFAIVNTRLVDLCIERGVLDRSSTMRTDNHVTRMLAEMLNLPLPDLSPDAENWLDTLRLLMLLDDQQKP